MHSYIDTHCHIDSTLRKGAIEHYPALKAEFPDNYEASIHVSCEPQTIAYGLEIINVYPEVYTALGIHPHDAKEYTDEIHAQLSAAMALPKVVAWGEMGLDYHYDFSPRDTQKGVFIRQLSAAIELNKPILIHTREAEEDTCTILAECLPKELPTHIHCFTGDLTFIQNLCALNKNLFFGFTGMITFKNSEATREAVKWLPLDQILLETDAPYMAPIPHRGKTAHQGMIPLIAEKIAEIKGLTIEDVFKACRENTARMYGI